MNDCFSICLADSIWGDKGNTTLIGELQLLQNKAAKTNLSLPSFSSSEGSIKYTWSTLLKRRLFHRCVFVFKYVNDLVDFNFDTKRNYDVHSYNTCGKTNFYLPRYYT